MTRHFILFLAGMMAASALCAAEPAGAAGPLPKVAPVDWSRLKPADFADHEIDMPYFLAHLSEVANAVVDEGPNRGFIALPVWRARSQNKPGNARIMENHVARTWFYRAKRPWNPYYGDPVLRQRLEAVLEYWCAIQSPDGRFMQYKEGKYYRAATLFAPKFMGHTLALLKDGPPIDAGLLRRVPTPCDSRSCRGSFSDFSRSPGSILHPPRPLPGWPARLARPPR